MGHYDNDQIANKSPPVEPDAHGQAALLLAESMLHALIATECLTTGQALDAVELAKEIKIEVATKNGESSRRMNQSLALLTSISDSLKADLLPAAPAQG